jgi:6-phosphogluconolactonase
MSNARANPTIETFADAQALAEASAAVLADALSRRLDEGPGNARLMLTGGSTPVACYEVLKDRPLDWGRVELALTDDRFVPPNDPNSNEKLVRDHLLKGPAAAAHLTPLWSDAGSPQDAAAKAEPGIRALGRMDAVLLGVGPDGHICSLFPGSPERAEGMDPDAGRLVIGVPKAEQPPYVPRITLTWPAFMNTDLVVILISGTDKKQVIEAALAGADMPVRAVLTQTQVPVRILWAA